MRIGVPREIKVHEYRVGLTPDSVRELVSHGHAVLVQTGAGAGIGQDDEAYRQAGAAIVPDAPGVYGEADLIVKVKEPQPAELPLLRPGQMLYTYLHLAPDAALTAEPAADEASAPAAEPDPAAAPADVVGEAAEAPKKKKKKILVDPDA